MSDNPNFTLHDKYLQQEGKIILTGAQALIRVPIDQEVADQKKGLNTATFISGYPGSPLGTLDGILHRNENILQEKKVKFQPGLNEDLAATAVWGSQMAAYYPKAKYDGVKGIWYGKSPGLARSGDAIKHGAFAGTNTTGGVLLYVGDDPVAKSSTLPSQSELSLADSYIPVLFPGNIQEIIDYGRLGFELSRYSGLWVGMKCVTDLMDAFGTAEVHPDRIQIQSPQFDFQGKPWKNENNLFVALPPSNLATERLIEEGRLPAAKAFIAANQLNIITVQGKAATVGIIAGGKPYYDVIESMRLLGIAEQDLENHGIRFLKLGCIYPIDGGVVKEFAKGLDKIIIVEEKRDLIEQQITRILYNMPNRPMIVGKKDENVKSLIPSFGELSPEVLTNIFATLLRDKLPTDGLQKRLASFEEIAGRPAQPLIPRTPHFCSGCPHNTSVIQVPEDSIIGAGIGCHGMSLIMPQAKTRGVTHMGGEGAQWVGMSAFSDTEHYFQNLGDGTFHHSGSLAIRFAVASGINITYKILYNEAVAMTGGQDVSGQMSVPALTRMLEAEGVQKIIVTTDNTDQYPNGARWAENVKVQHRDHILEAQELLKKTKGVTVLIHHQGCAAELRRARKKGIIEAPPQRVFINEEVCEGCNDCGVKSNCLSVQPTDTEFGRKNKIDQSSCNVDYSCLKGDCPSFITIIPDKDKSKTKAKKSSNQTIDLDLDNFPIPNNRVGESASIYLMGIGGTGVITINQILGTAAKLDNKFVYSTDQVGLAQKGGSVISHFKITQKAQSGSNRVTMGNADAYIGFDLLTAANDKHLQKATADKTIAIVNTEKTPTGLMLSMPGMKFPDLAVPLARIEQFTNKDKNLYYNAIAISNNLFSSHYFANIMMIGTAYQLGVLPIAAEKIETAIKHNGIKPDQNIMAFRVGRRLAIQPDLIPELEISAIAKAKQGPTISDKAKNLIGQVGMNGSVQKALKIRVPELIAYQNINYAQQYIDFLKQVALEEQAVAPTSTKLTETVAKYLYKLMAYKDEYEVARLHTKATNLEQIKAQFGDKAKVAIMLHPPILRAMGYHKKIKFGKWTFPFFRIMSKGKFLRGTALDIFGYPEIRKTERALIAEYKELIEGQLETLTIASLPKVIELAALPDMIRGYEDIKMEGVRKFRERVAGLGLSDL